MDDLFPPSNLLSRCIDIAPQARVKVESAPEIGGERILLEGGELLFSEHFFSDKVCKRMIEYLQESRNFQWKVVDWAQVPADQLKEVEFENVNWKQDYIKFFGKTHPLPRLTAWYGDKGASYAYSGIRSDPNPWNDGLLYLKARLEAALDVTFNSVLLNWYRDGSDSLNWHADDEPELGTCPTIASVSFGETRQFLFKPKNASKTQLSFDLLPGSLVVMKGETQQNWVHSVPKRKGVKGSRFNLTFRNIRVV
ncbi:alkylated DNA repair dioxygenase AlkB [Sphingomonas kaistensis]|uniref:Alkylated DNA repair dioxygenase AlkB n=1 Tax=Sphingomonas kaistensis TaxID=298708 RepID=A0A7X6BHM9_9SPHN|nr:alkylated DNA repair dioxygenase AlkB [Sphingomonas kaistensis]